MSQPSVQLPRYIVIYYYYYYRKYSFIPIDQYISLVGLQTGPAEQCKRQMGFNINAYIYITILPYSIPVRVYIQPGIHYP